MAAVYDVFKIQMPNKVKVANYLVYQFEHSNFNFDVVLNEEKLQESYEVLANLELTNEGTGAGEKLATRNTRSKTLSKIRRSELKKKEPKGKKVEKDTTELMIEEQTTEGSMELMIKEQNTEESIETMRYMA